TSDISLVYVLYMGGALCGLLFLGRLPDRLGFRPMLRLGLILVLAGTFLTLIAWDLVSLCIGRFVVGVASSLLTTSSTLGLARLVSPPPQVPPGHDHQHRDGLRLRPGAAGGRSVRPVGAASADHHLPAHPADRKSTRLNSSHVKISYAVCCLKK